MAISVSLTGFVSLAGVDITDHVTACTVSHSVELQDSTAFGSSTRTREAGLRDWSVDLTVQADEASSSVNATLFSNIGSSIAFIGRATSSAVSSTNPNYTGNVYIESIQPIASQHGQIKTQTVRLAGNGALSRATS